MTDMTDNNIINIGDIILKAGDILRDQGISDDNANNAILAVFDDYSEVVADMLAIDARMDLHGFLVARLVMDARAIYYGITDYEIVRQADEAEDERETAAKHLAYMLIDGTDEEVAEAEERQMNAEAAYSFIACRSRIVDAARRNLQAYSRACKPR